MANKLGNLDVSLLNIGGTSFLGLATDTDFNVGVLTELCKSISDRYDSEEPVKKEFKWTAGMIPHVAGICQSGLTATVMSYDGTNYIAEVTSFSLKITTKLNEGDGVSEVWKWFQAGGTSYEITVEKLITTNAALFHMAMDNNITSIKAQLILTAGETSVTVPVTIGAASHKIENDSLQMENVTMKNRGEPVAATGDALILEILTGDAYVAWSVETGAGDYNGNAIIESGEMTITNGALNKHNFGFANQGAPSYVAA